MAQRLEQLSPLQRAVYALKETKSRLDELERRLKEPIAIVGMACRFPGGANDPDAYWRMLCDGVDAIGEVPADRWDADAFFDADPRAIGKMNSRLGGFVDGMRMFDNGFFGISDDEARLMDPQQRMLLELTWEALEDAGIPPSRLRGSRTGVFIGISSTEFGMMTLRDYASMGAFASTGAALSIAANRVSFAFDFHGPSIALDTACSSSLVALHMACQAIRGGQCTTAIVGGTNMVLSPVGTINLTKAGLSSVDGRVRAFDRAASGYVRSDGAGVVVLKAQSAAERDGERPYALVRGSAVRQNGWSNGLMAPVGKTQEDTIRAACEQAEIAPREVCYVETQGTGTLLGDAIEARALGTALADERENNQTCAIGSVKTNIGHTEAAAGIAGVIKVALALRHRQLPPSLHFQSPSPMIPFEQLALRVQTELEQLPDRDEPYVAGVNGFGYGGSTAHILLQEAREPQDDPAATPTLKINSANEDELADDDSTQPRVLPISAKTEQALKEVAARYREFLLDESLCWSDVCSTAWSRRTHHEQRLAVIAESAAQAAEAIDAFLRNEQTAHWFSAESDAEALEVSASSGASHELARAFVAGRDDETLRIDAGDYSPVRLPTYAWQRNELWPDCPNPWHGTVGWTPSSVQNQGTDAVQSVRTDEGVHPTELRARPELETPFVTATTPLQQKIAETWRRVLSVDRVGIDDNFFALGGASLQAGILLHELQGWLRENVQLIALFEAQTVRDLAVYLETHHAAAVERAGLLAAAPTPANEVANLLGDIVPVPRGEPLPLSFGQQRFWFLDQLNPGAPAYNIHVDLPLIGALDPATFERAVEYLVARHEPLRTVFQTIDEEPCQVILDTWNGRLLIKDWRDQDADERERTVAAFSEEQSNTSFDLRTGPLFQMTLVRTGESEHRLLFTVHHIVIDGYSLTVLFPELLDAYNALAGGQTPPLPEMTVQYADYAVWQRRNLQGQWLAAELEFWKRKLAGLAPLELPADWPRSAQGVQRRPTHAFVVPADLNAKCRELCQRQRITPYMLMLATYQVLLHRYSGSRDIGIASPVAGRARRETQTLIGFFVNTVVVRCDLADEPTFEELLSRVRQSAFDSLAHQDLPFDQLVNELDPERTPGRNPIVQVLFNFLQEDVQRMGSLRDGLSIGKIPEEHQPAGGEYDITLTILERAGELRGVLGYNAELFDAATIERMAGHWLNLLSALVADPGQSVSRVDFLSDDERRRIVAAHRRDAACCEPTTFLQMFEQQVERTPDQAALRFEDEQLTYRELNRRANQVAHRLIELGAGPEQRIALLADRSARTIIGLLGIQKSGAAYLPIDPETPQSRIALMLADAAVELAVAPLQFADQLPLERSRILSVDEDEPAAADVGNSNPTGNIAPENLAYVIYTSGSTGQPKGVAVEHRQVTNYTLGIVARIGFEAGWQCALVSSVATDLGNTMIFGALSTGGCLHVLSKERSLDPLDFAEYFAAHSIDCLKIVPSHFAALLSGRDVRAMPRKRLILGGEASRAEWVGELRKLHPDCRIFNHYGPTETTVGVLVHEFDDQPTSTRTGTSPLGVALPNCAVYILDEHMNPVPIGVEGELCIGDAAVSRGYLNRPELIGRHFVTDPFSSEPQARMYRTGDRARRLPDGNIEFLGRRDSQIKIRGVRIETGEVEAVLKQHAAIRDAVVDARPNATGDKQLVAWIVINNQRRPEIAELDAFVTEQLPAALRPAAFLFVDEIERLPNGKVNRAVLPDPTQGESAARTTFAAPRTSTEMRLAEIWSELLSVERIGIHDNFFDLGGHSLLATRVVMRVSQNLKANIRLRVLFEGPTIAQLAAHVDATLHSDKQVDAPIEATADRERDFPLSHMQEAMWLIEQLTDGPSNYAIVGALRLTGTLDVAALERAVNEVSRRHESLRTAFPNSASGPVQRISPFEYRPLEVVDVTDRTTGLMKSEPTALAAGAENAGCEPSIPEASAYGSRAAHEDIAKQFLDEERLRRFDLQDETIVRIKLLKLSEQEHVMILSGHHIVFDAWSSGLLVREIWHAYGALAAGFKSSLGALPVQFADYAVWQRERLQGGGEDSLLEYWRAKLADVPSLELPYLRRKDQPAGRGDERRIHLPSELSQRMRQFCRERDVTPFMLTLATFQVVLSRYSGQIDFPIGTPVSGRLRPEAEDLIGCFINSVVIRGDLSGEPSFAELLHRVRATTLEAFDHQELPFDRLVTALNPGRESGRHPIFQVLFNYLHSPPGATTTIAGLTVEPIEADGDERLKHDLNLTLTDHDSEFDVALRYDTSRFDPAQIDAMLELFCLVIESGIKNAESPIGELADQSRGIGFQPVANVEETTGWKPIPRPTSSLAEPLLTCVQHQFEARAAETPNAIAVVCDGQRLTYDELNSRANRLSHHLRELGVSVESLVGVYLSRTLELPIAYLAVLKAGAAFVPLDPDLPQRRLAAITEDSRPRAVITTNSLAAGLTDYDGPLVRVDGDAECIAAASTDNPATTLTLENAAYVLYTSGSTGTPKGAVNCHVGLANLLRAEAKIYEFSAEDRFLARAPIGFDASVNELLRPFGVGGRLMLASDEQYKNPAGLVQLIQREQVTFAQFVPAVLQAFLEEDGVENCTTLRQVISGGDVMTRELAERFRDRLSARLYNRYGPTETAIAVCVWPVQHDYPYACIPIGKPFEGVRFYVLDERLRPVPLGSEGELYIGGLAVAREYLNRPELTAASFVPDPFADRPEARMYRTGDRCRWLPDGNIEYRGRRDTQIKLRGVRIEAGEIESVLKQHAGVRDAIVDARKNDASEKRLVAWIVAAGDPPPPVDSLRAFLAERLPRPMCPAELMFVERLPLQFNGKVDRRSLPDPATSNGARSTQYAAPHTATQQRLAEIWSELLGVEQVGIHDNFFDLGGHSLLVTRAISSINTSLGARVTMRSIFEHPTIAQLAERIESSATGGASHPKIPASPDRDRDFPLSSIQESLWLIDQLSDGRANYRTGGVLRLSGPLDVAALEQSIDEIVRRHEVLRTVFPDVAGVPVQRVRPFEPQPLETGDLTAIPAERRDDEVRRSIDEESARSIDLSRGPAFRVKLLKLAEREHVLLVVGHHIVFDGWSSDLLMREIGQAYRSLVDGRAPRLPKLPIQYADFALWQRERLQGEHAATLLDYWRNKLAALPQLELPNLGGDDNAAAGQTDRRLNLSSALTSAMQQFCRDHDVSPFMLTMTAFQVVLSHYSRQLDFPIGTPLAGRSQPETEELIGCFINSVVIRCDLNGDPTFADLIARVKETSLEAFDHQELPFDRLVADLKPPRRSGRHPLFQVIFNYRHMSGARSLQVADLTVTSLDNDSHSGPQFDLALTVFDRVGEFDVLLGYDRRRFDAAAADQILARLCEVLEAGIAQPMTQVNELLAGSRDSAGETFPRMFEQQVEKTPELGEIESALRRQPGVREAIVLTATNQAGANQLTAYVVPEKHLPELDGHDAYRLPNNLLVAHLNKNETDYLYREVFQLQAYLRHGITIEDGDVLFDVGANIGLFSLLANQLCGNARVYAFEPNPVVFPILAANARAHGSSTRVFECGVSRVDGEGELTYFQGFSLLSGFYADAEQEKSVVKSFMRNQQSDGHAGMSELLDQADDFLEQRFVPHHYKARLRTLSAVIAEEGIQRIDLLKINVEKSELDILEGIRDEDWSKIRQLVIEVDVAGHLPRIRDLLATHGYDTVVAQDQLLAGTALCYVYAIRADDQRTLIAEQPHGAHLRELPVSEIVTPTPRELQDALAICLPEYMIPSSISLVDALPLTPNGKLDRAALSGQPEQQSGPRSTFVPPRTTVEKQLAEIWSELLSVPRVGVHDRFFDLGGHSLIATRIVSRVNQTFGTSLRLRTIFEDATIAGCAARIEEALSEKLSSPPSSIPRAPRDQLIPPSLDSVSANNLVAAAGNRESTLVHEMFASQAAQSPDSVAVVCAAQQMTYGEVNRRANQLAHYLRRQGVQSGDVVGVYLNRSVDLTVSVLAVLKADAVVLPLDPDYPPQRLSLIVADSRPKTIITYQSLSGDIGADQSQMICLDAEASALRDESTLNPTWEAALDHAAYVIYTSGSTGQPKGALNSHRGLANLVQWEGKEYSLSPQDRVLGRAPIGFDVFLIELLRALCHGAQFFLADEQQYKDPAELVRLMHRQQITFVHFVPAIWSEMLKVDEIRNCTSLRVVVAGGDVLPPDLVRRHFDQLDVRLENQYGPAETSITATSWRCQRDAAYPSVPIGRPLDNISIYLLDADQQAVADGETGELVIGGDAVGRGYLNRPELTAEVFLPDPFVNKPDAMMYRTGDWGRRLPDNNIEFLGRRDTQVKIRGVRIEIGEIESALRQHDLVTDAVVDARTLGPEHKQLVAYVVRANDQVSAEQLGAFVTARLPLSMRPAAFVFIDRVPLSPNGKIDRRLLPDPEQRTLARRGTNAPPLTATEATLAAIWREFIDKEQFGADDDFFELGGHSLIAMRIVSRVNVTFGTSLPLRSLFENATIPKFARQIEQSLSTADSHQAFSIPRAPRDQRIPLTAMQLAMWNKEHSSIDPSPYSMASGFRLIGELDVASLERAVNLVRDRHEALRTVFPSVAGAPVQHIQPFEPQALEVLDLTRVAPDQRDEHIRQRLLEDMRNKIDLQRGPIVRIKLLSFSPQDHLLLVTGHHVVFDGWSSRILTGEIGLAYDAFSRGREPALAQLPVQHADYALWQQGRLSGAVGERLAQYWRDSLRGSARIRLPVLRSTAIQQSRIATAELALPPELCQRIQQFCAERNASSYMLVLAAFQIVLSRHCGQTDFVIGSTVAGRVHADIQGLIGCFINTVAVRCDLTGNPTFDELLSRVGAAAVQTLDHQEYPYPELAKIDGLCDPAHPLTVFPAKVTYHHLPKHAPAKLGDLELSQFTVRGDRPPKQPLCLRVKDHEGDLELQLAYDASLLDPAQIASMLEQCQEILQSGIADPRITISQLPAVAPREIGQVFSKFNNASAGVALLSRPMDPVIAANEHHSSVARIADRGRDFPLFPVQQRAWRLEHETTKPTRSNMIHVVRLSGRLNVAAMEQAINEMRRRHEALRTTFPLVGQSPVQRIAPFAPQPLPVIDMSEIAMREFDDRVARRARSEYERKAPLQHGPIVRIELLKNSDTEHALLVAGHHIIFDGWSLGVLIRELGLLYAVLAEGFASPLDDLPVQPADCAVWLQQRLAGQVGEQLAEYWDRQLADVPRLRVRTFPRGEQGNVRKCSKVLSPELSRRCAEFSKSQDISSFMLLTAAYQIVLARHSQQSLFPIDTPVAGRVTPESEPLISCFSSLAILRCDLTGNPTFGELLARVRETTLAALDHQEFPFDRVQHVMFPPPGDDAIQYVSAGISYRHETKSQPLQLPGLSMRPVEWKADSLPRRDLDLYVAERDGEFEFSLAYDSSLFDESTIRQMAGQIESVLEAGVARPGTRVNEWTSLALTTSAERAPEEVDRVREGDSETDSPLVRLASGSAQPLFVVHGMGGHVMNLMPLGSTFEKQRDVFALQAAGLNGGRPPHDDIREMARYYVAALREVQPRGPYLLAGWSLGGTIAWEMATQLQAQGESVSRLALFDSYPLWLAKPSKRLQAAAERILPQLGPDFADIAKLPKEQRWDALVARANAPTTVGADVIRGLIQTCQAHVAAAASFCPEPLDVPVVQFWAADGRRLHPNHVWKSLCPVIRFESVPGGHYTMLERPNADVLAKSLQDYLHPESSRRKAG